MGTRSSSNRARRKLTALRLAIARARTRLGTLHAAIRDAHGDSGLAAVQDVKAEIDLLRASGLLAAQAAGVCQAALDVALTASQTDPLTGLHNRRVLWDRLAHDLDLATRHGQHVAVLLLDLDEFKQLNDQYGHAVGDLALQRIARVLNATVRASDTVCRLGGDEFVVLASTAHRQDVDRLARKIEDAIRQPLVLAGHTIKLGVSLGYSVFPEDGNAAEALVNKADAAMYRIKRSRSASTGG